MEHTFQNKCYLTSLTWGNTSSLWSLDHSVSFSGKLIVNSAANAYSQRRHGEAFCLHAFCCWHWVKNNKFITVPNLTPSAFPVNSSPKKPLHFHNFLFPSLYYHLYRRRSHFNVPHTNLYMDIHERIMLSTSVEQLLLSWNYAFFRGHTAKLILYHLTLF